MWSACARNASSGRGRQGCGRAKTPGTSPKLGRRGSWPRRRQKLWQPSPLLLAILVQLVNPFNPGRSAAEPSVARGLSANTVRSARIVTTASPTDGSCCGSVWRPNTSSGALRALPATSASFWTPDAGGTRASRSIGNEPARCSGQYLMLGSVGAGFLAAMDHNALSAGATCSPFSAQRHLIVRGWSRWPSGGAGHEGPHRLRARVHHRRNRRRPGLEHLHRRRLSLLPPASGSCPRLGGRAPARWQRRGVRATPTGRQVHQAPPNLRAPAPGRPGRHLEGPSCPPKPCENPGRRGGHGSGEDSQGVRPMNGTFAREALRYHHAGLNVLPVVLGSKHPPVGLTWRRWQVHHQTEAEVGQLIEAHPSADVALITGGPSHLVDVETDSRAGEGALRELRLPVPATACFTSPRGAHRLYRALHPLPSRIGFRPGLDVLAARRYVLVPRSTGREWLTPGGIEAVAPLPEAWESILGGDGEQRTGEALRQVENEGVEEGRRDDTLAALVGRWLTQGMPEAEIRRRACAWARRCTAMTHPFDEAQAEKVVRSIICARERIRSPEGKALLRARDFGLHPAERFVLVGLETLRTELGVPQGHEFAGW